VRLTIFGATGGTGRRLLERAIAEGHATGDGRLFNYPVHLLSRWVQSHAGEMRTPLPSLAWQWSIHDPAYRSSTRCRSPSPGVDALGSEPCGFEAMFYAGSWIWSSQNFPWPNFGESGHDEEGEDDCLGRFSVRCVPLSPLYPTLPSGCQRDKWSA
jgi:hypothetical protein